MGLTHGLFSTGALGWWPGGLGLTNRVTALDMRVKENLSQKKNEGKRK